LPEVICTTFDEYQVYLQSLTKEQFQDYKKGKFDISGQPALPDFIQNPPQLQFVERLLDSTFNEKMGCTPEVHIEEVDVNILNES
jgi:hypothetical protein